MSRTNDISSDNFYTKSRGQRKAWPEGCIWPEPVWDSVWGGNYWDVEDADLMKTDENMEDLLEIREYMDSLKRSTQTMKQQSRVWEMKKSRSRLKKELIIGMMASMLSPGRMI